MKMLFVLVSFFSFYAQADVCTVDAKNTFMAQLSSSAVVANAKYNQPTTVALSSHHYNRGSLTFKLESVPNSPDTSLEFVSIEGFDSDECSYKTLYNSKNIYAGNETTCQDPEYYWIVTVACRFR